jgi:hypothetical protein
MKTSRSRHLFVYIYTGLFSLNLVTPGIAQQSVTIPAQSSSTLDTPEEAKSKNSASVPVPARTSPFSGNSVSSRVMVPATTPGAGNISSVSQRVADPSTRNSAPVPELPSTAPDVATIKRLAELRRELRVSESATMARISLPTDDVFSENTEATIDPLAITSLGKVVEFMERNDKKNVTIKALYIPEVEGAKELAWARSLGLIEWLKANSALEPDRIKAATPEPLAKAVAKVNATEAGDTEFVSRIELNLE